MEFSITGADVAQIIIALGLLVTAIGTLYTARKINKVESQTNGMSKQLEEVARKEGRAQGKAEEQIAQGERPTPAVATAVVPVPILTTTPARPDVFPSAPK